MNTRSTIARVLLGVWLALAPAVFAAPALAAQDAAQTPVAPDPTAPAGATDTPPDYDATSMPLQQYNDPEGRFGLVAPVRWGRLPSASRDEVVFQSDDGDNLRVSVAPLKVDPKSFSSAYVDTYLKVLAQTFSDVKYLGEREVTVSFHKATDYVFSATYGNASVICHQVVLLGGDKVLYMTFAGFGRSRSQAEQLFQTALLSLWVGPGFGGATAAGVADPNAPAYVLAIPEGWMDQGEGDANSHVFRPPGARRTSAFVSTRVTKLGPNDALTKVDDAFVATYAATLRDSHPENAFEMKQTRTLFLGGETAVRYDYGYISNYGVRRAILVLCVHKGYVVAISCDSADTSFGRYEPAFESLVTGLKFK
jgi:hypothetical protein